MMPDDELNALKDRISQMSDNELLEIVEVEYIGRLSHQICRIRNRVWVMVAPDHRNKRIKTRAWNCSCRPGNGI